ncbi:nucleic acid/nucleotide deaminase domain-containing protein [Kitasatospora sp. NPDC057542]|uniref:nucleic acid/nucleotide deaminase domain-containing protein n=1 Tax=Streptomycetaceae TaxID=2062 RepID=UPI001CCB2C58|nr:nucleic acid/nucleotide deaminase domain-containing protein [Streptomyces sp. LS1784]
MTQSGDRLVQRFGEAGVRRFDAEQTDPFTAERQALENISRLVLPLQVLPYFHTVADEPASLSRYATLIGRQLDQESQLSWARLGSDRAYDLCVTPEGTVRGAMLGYDEPERFVNSTPEAFAEGLLQLDIALEAIGGTDDPAVAGAALDGLESALRAADGQALADPEHWWSLVLEDIRTTASVLSYSSFEFVTSGGGKQIVTESSALCVHAEERVWSAMYAAGVEPDQVTRIHTELQACFMPGHYCAFWLKLMFPDAALTHNVPYGDTAAERAGGLIRLQEAHAATEEQA